MRLTEDNKKQVTFLEFLDVLRRKEEGIYNEHMLFEDSPELGMVHFIFFSFEYRGSLGCGYTGRARNFKDYAGFKYWCETVIELPDADIQNIFMGSDMVEVRESYSVTYKDIYITMKENEKDIVKAFKALDDIHRQKFVAHLLSVDKQYKYAFSIEYQIDQTTINDYARLKHLSAPLAVKVGGALREQSVLKALLIVGDIPAGMYSVFDTDTAKDMSIMYGQDGRTRFIGLGTTRYMVADYDSTYKVKMKYSNLLEGKKHKPYEIADTMLKGMEVKEELEFLALLESAVGIYNAVGTIEDRCLCNDDIEPITDLFRGYGINPGMVLVSTEDFEVVEELLGMNSEVGTVRLREGLVGETKKLKVYALNYIPKGTYYVLPESNGLGWLPLKRGFEVFPYRDNFNLDLGYVGSYVHGMVLFNIRGVLKVVRVDQQSGSMVDGLWGKNESLKDKLAEFDKLDFNDKNAVGMTEELGKLLLAKVRAVNDYDILLTKLDKDEGVL